MDPRVSEIFRAIDLLGVFTSAVLGGVVARHARFDPIGFAVLALLSGMGGGVIRDVLLQDGPPVALTHNIYLITALAAAGLTYTVNVDGRLWQKVWPVIDATALGCWAAAGALRTLSVGLGWLPAILLGTVSAVGGGMIREIVLGRVPSVLGGNTLYATSAVAASAVMVGFAQVGHPSVGLFVAIVVGGGSCLLARWRGWMLPSADAWSATYVGRFDRINPFRRRR